MAGPYYFAWVNETDTAWNSSFKRFDEDVFDFDLTHEEGEHPLLSLTIRNPRMGLLSPSRKYFAWLAYDHPNGTTVPLFFGRIVGIPTGIQGEMISIQMLGRPQDYDTQKRALAETMKVDPFYDDVWIIPERRSDPDVVLEARAVAWHTGRIDQLVTFSDIGFGEDGTVVIDPSDVIADSIDVSYGEPPLRRVSISGKVLWTQAATGQIDATKKIEEAFEAVGARHGFIESYTGQGLFDDWPSDDDDIGGGWAHGDVVIKSADGTVLPRQSKKVWVKYETAPEQTGQTINRFDLVIPQRIVPFRISVPLWRFTLDHPIKYEAARDRSEEVRITLSAEVQHLMFNESETEELVLPPLSSSEIVQDIDGEGSNATKPIIDVRSSQYFVTDRGGRSIRYLIAMLVANLYARARAVFIDFQVPFDIAQTLSCRLSATITSPKLPGGTATGKIVAYGFSVDGASGEKIGRVRIACMIGKGTSITVEAGNPMYVDDDYVEDDYQEREGETVFGVDDQVTYQPIVGPPPNDDNVNFFDMRPETTIESVTVIQGGMNQQNAVLDGIFLDVTSVTEALNAVFTRCRINCVPVEGGPFDNVFDLVTSPLVIPKTIDLEGS